MGGSAVSLSSSSSANDLILFSLFPECELKDVVVRDLLLAYGTMQGLERQCTPLILVNPGAALPHRLKVVESTVELRSVLWRALTAQRRCKVQQLTALASPPLEVRIKQAVQIGSITVQRVTIVVKIVH